MLAHRHGVDTDELSGLVLSSLRALLAALVLLGCQLLAFRPANLPLQILVVAAVLSGALTYGASRAGERFACLVLVTGLTAGISLAAIQGDAPALWPFLTVPVVMSGSLFGPAAAPIMGVVASAVVYALNPGSDTHLTYAALPLLTGLCTWAAYRPMYSSLRLALRRSFEATTLAEQLRDQRGKLNRTIKALDDSYQLLEKTNRDLLLARREADTLRDLRSRFATNLSHELRTPLNIILGFSQLIYTKPQLYGYDRWRDALLRDLSELRRNAGYLSDLVDDIVDLARVDALAMPIRRELSDLAEVIGEAVVAAAALAQEKGLSIQVTCATDMPPLRMDPVRIRQVLFNLLTNAIRHTEQGPILVEAEPREGEVVVSVSDSGCGIPQEELASIFDEFYQVGRLKAGPDSGKGLGLAIARRFVQLHGGSIWAESTPGLGSTFFFSLPVADKAVSLSRKPLVLILNDDGTAAGYLRRRLEDCEFASVADVAQWEEALARESPAAVVVNTPVGSPASPQHQLAGLLPDAVPVIECSLPNSQWLSGAEQFSAVLTKPVTQERLLETLKNMMPELSRATVLIADDDRSFVQLIRRVLQSAPENGYGVLTAYGGAEALRKARRFRPDAILLDLLMPDMSGFDVLAAIRQEEELRQTPVIAVTAATPGEDEMSQKGAHVRLAKRSPFRPGELVGLISLAVGCGANPLAESQGSGAGQPAARARIPAS